MSAIESYPLEYEIAGNISQEKLTQTVQEFWEEALAKNAAVREKLKLPAGTAVPARLRKMPFKLKRDSGVEPMSATLLVAAGVAGIRIGTRVTLDIWKEVVLPRLKDRFGTASIRAKNPSKPRKAKKARKR